MTTNQVNDDDLLHELDAADETIFEPLIRLDEKMTAGTKEANQQLELVLKHTEELKLQLDDATQLTDVLKSKYEEKLRIHSQRQQVRARNEELRRIEQEKIASLSMEVTTLETQLEELDNEPFLDSLTDHEQLQMALFRGMGIEMKVEEDGKVRKAILSSPNQQDIITFPIDNYSKEFTANYIWDFISKGL